MKKNLCVRCHEPVGDHTRSMQLVSPQQATPKPGYYFNLHQCIARGGPKYSRSSGVMQQGEGRFFLPQGQMR